MGTVNQLLKVLAQIWLQINIQSKPIYFLIQAYK